jgi:hypothetical protein
MGQLIHPLDTMEDAVTAETLDIRNIMKRYQAHTWIKIKRFFSVTSPGGKKT